MAVWEGMFQNLYTEIKDAGFNRDYRGGSPIMRAPYGVDVNVF
jgi:hypothetical protein